MVFFWILIIVIVIGMGVWHLEKVSNIFSGRLPKNNPIDILKRRFANGEITEEEYNEKRAILEEDEFLNLKP